MSSYDVAERRSHLSEKEYAEASVSSNSLNKSIPNLMSAATNASSVTSGYSGLSSTELYNTTNGTSSFSATSGPPCADILPCNPFHTNISTAILTLGIIAFLENFLLVIAMVTWNLNKTCKMFWFLWHLALADAILALAFMYYHIRIISSCPTPFSCQKSFEDESLVLVVGFFGPITASHLFVVAATVDRFISIKWSLRYIKIVTTFGCRITAAVIWVVAFTIPFIGVFGIKYVDNIVTYSALSVVTSSICLCCAGSVIFLNLWMVSSAWSSIKKIPGFKGSRNRRSTGSVLPDLLFFQDRLKLAITLSLFVCSFVLSCAPWSVALVICKEISKCSIKRDQDYTLVLVLFHAVAIPLLYGFRVEVVKSRVIGFWKNLLPCIEKCNNERTEA